MTHNEVKPQFSSANNNINNNSLNALSAFLPTSELMSQSLANQIAPFGSFAQSLAVQTAANQVASREPQNCDFGSLVQQGAGGRLSAFDDETLQNLATTFNLGTFQIQRSRNGVQMETEI